MVPELTSMRLGSLDEQPICQQSLSSRTELRDSQQIVGSRYQVGGEAGPLDPSIARAPKVTDRFAPAEDFLDSLAYPLAQRVTGPAGGALVEGRASGSPLILRNMRCDVEFATSGHESRAVIALVASDGDPS